MLSAPPVLCFSHSVSLPTCVIYELLFLAWVAPCVLAAHGTDYVVTPACHT